MTSEDQPAPLMVHLRELASRMKRVLLVMLVVTLGVWSFTFESIPGTSIPLIPVPTLDGSLTLGLYRWLVDSLLPSGVDDPVAFSPLEALSVQLQLSFFVGFMVTVPYATYQFYRFALPGLTDDEKRSVRLSVAPAFLLFYAGVFVSLLFLLPPIVDFLFIYPTAMDATVYYSMERFVGFVIMFSIAFGLCFELPLIQYLLSSMEIIEASFWKEQWREAMLVLVLFGAAVTPDGTGVTLFMVAAPLGFLYWVGYRMALRGERRE